MLDWDYATDRNPIASSVLWRRSKFLSAFDRIMHSIDEAVSIALGVAEPARKTEYVPRPDVGPGYYERIVYEDGELKSQTLILTSPKELAYRR